MTAKTYTLFDQYDRRYGPKALPMVTLDFELDLAHADEGPEHELYEAAYFCVDFWLN